LQQFACVAASTTSITIRDVPHDVRDELAARAARAGRSLREHLRAELIALARRPSAEALVERVRARKAATRTKVATKRILTLRDAERR
jgi:hypothetical protein